MYEVFHFQQPADRDYHLFGGDPVYAANAWKTGMYKKVAVVHSDDLDDCFQATNHIQYEWQKNHNVTAEPGRQRSTSVGDVIRGVDGQLWLVMGMGFSKLEV